MTILFLLLGLGAMLAMADMGGGSSFSSSGSGNAEDDTDDTDTADPTNPEDPTDPPAPPPAPDLPGTALSTGLSVVTGDFVGELQQTFYLSHAYTGSGLIEAEAEFARLDLSLYSGDLRITVGEGGVLQLADTARPDFISVFFGDRECRTG